MSQENVEAVKQFEEMMVPSLQEEDEETAKKRFAAILDLLDDEVAFVPCESMPHGGDYIGHEGFVKLGEAFSEAWDLPTGVDFQYLDGGGDKVVILARFDAVSKHTGKSVEFKMVEIITVRDGKILELVPYYYDTVPIKEACGGVKTGLYKTAI